MAEITLQEILTNKKHELRKKDIVTIIEYDDISKIITSNNIIFTEKQKSMYVYCIIQNPLIKIIDVSHLCKNNIIKKFQLLVTHNEEIPEIYGADTIKINIIQYKNLDY